MLFLPVKNTYTLTSTIHTSQISHQFSTFHSNLPQMQSSVPTNFTTSTSTQCLLYFNSTSASSYYGILSTLEVMVESISYEIFVVGPLLQLR